jgi:hypothetical protein
MLSERFVAVCLIVLGIVTTMGGIALAAKCRDQAATCCISFAGVGLLCRVDPPWLSTGSRLEATRQSAAIPVGGPHDDADPGGALLEGGIAGSAKARGSSLPRNLNACGTGYFKVCSPMPTHGSRWWRDRELRTPAQHLADAVGLRHDLGRVTRAPPDGPGARGSSARVAFQNLIKACRADTSRCGANPPSLHTLAFLNEPCPSG